MRSSKRIFGLFATAAGSREPLQSVDFFEPCPKEEFVPALLSRYRLRSFGIRECRGGFPIPVLLDRRNQSRASALGKLPSKIGNWGFRFRFQSVIDSF